MSEEKIRNYLDQQVISISVLKNSYKPLIEIYNIIKNARDKNTQIFVMGNGGSAAIATHVAVDFTKLNSIRSTNFNEANLITCFANDYGYENWLAKALEYYSVKDDLVILISSSGRSPNIIKAAQKT